MSGRRVMALSVIGFCVMVLAANCFASSPEEMLREALADFRQGRYERFTKRVRESLQVEWHPSIYGPNFTLVAVPSGESGNVSFALLREIARSFHDWLAQRPVEKEQARLLVDYLLKLVRSRSPHPDIYFLVIRACWVMLEHPLARYFEQHGTAKMRKAFAEVRQIYNEDYEYLHASRQRHHSDQKSSQIAKYAAKRLSLWENRLQRLQQLLE
jgi:hypothetical protein